jgi:hypothetical protein
VTISVLSSSVLYALAGGVAGYAVVKLREAEREISMVQAREEVARTLTTGVAADARGGATPRHRPDLSRLARDQERELREYLFGAEPPAGTLGPRLRQAPARFEDHYGGGARSSSPTTCRKLVRRRSTRCRRGREALANAGKHGRRAPVTVLREPEDDGACSAR